MKVSWPFALILSLSMVSCVSEHEHEEDCTHLEPQDVQPVTLRQGMTVDEVTGCSLAAVRGLDEQIIDEMNCLVEDVLVDFSDLNVSLAGTSPWAKLQPSAKAGLRRAISARGITFRANSIYRPISQQYLLYQWYQRGQCGIGLAAAPGRSNHQSGLAVDISDYTGWRPYLEAEGWQWYGAGDVVHFTYTGSGTQDIRDTAVLAFQRLWNRNNPNNLIGEDGSYGPQTETALRATPLEGFAQGANCGGQDPDPDPDPEPEDAEVTVSLGIDDIPGQARDLVSEGSSAGIFDLLEDQQGRLTFTVRNGAGRPATDDVIIGYSVEQPWLGLRSYTIESDYPDFDGRSWQVSDATGHPNNPALGGPPSSGVLHLYPMSPGESKRVALTLEGAGYDEDGGKPVVRLWVQHIGDYYGEGNGWDDPVEVNQAPDLLRRQAVLDVLSTDHWAWNGNQAQDLEGWAPCGDSALRTEAGQLMLLGGRDSCVQSPDWTNIDADNYKALSIRMRHVHDGADSRLLWRCPDTGEFGGACSATFKVTGDGSLQTVDIDLSGVSSWSGNIQGLRVFPVAESVELDTVGLDELFPLTEAGAEPDPDPDPDPDPEPDPDPNNSSNGPNNNTGPDPDPDPNDGKDPGPDPDPTAGDGNTIKSTEGCSTTPGDRGRSMSGGLWLLLALGFFGRLRAGRLRVGRATQPDA